MSRASHKRRYRHKARVRKLINEMVSFYKTGSLLNVKEFVLVKLECGYSIRWLRDYFETSKN